MLLLATWWLFGLFQLFIIKGCHAVFVQVTPKEILALPNQKVEFLCTVGVPIQYCRVEVPGMKHLNLNPNAPPFEGISYTGSGLHAGQCGVAIDSVKEENNGEIKCTLGIPTESQESSTTMRLIVARSPRAPELEIMKESEHFWAYKVGDVLRAQCIVRDGRPVANITWYLDDEPLPSSLLTAPTVVNGNQEDLQTVYQNLSKELRPSDNGRALKCVASHPAMTQNNFAYRQLNVTYPPLPQSNPIDRFGYTLGFRGVITLEIEANPRPLIEWNVRDQVIKEGHTDNEGRIKAAELKDLGRGIYEAELWIADINKQDTETQYILRAYNDMGTQDYIILISTSSEPEDLELGVLPIIGIVISILIVILVVFLIVFARITGRWCFSADDSNVGGTTRTGFKHSGESSDTESVVDVRHKEQQKQSRRKFLPSFKLNVVFKKKDKQQQNEAEDDEEDEDEERPKSAETVETKIPSDEGGDPIVVNKQTPDPKEGIVYAELDLGNNPNLKPLVKNDDDKTEYAEIVYTQKDGEDGGGNKVEQSKSAPAS